MSENYKKEITCPYCKYEHSDSWDMRCDEGTEECYHCGESFTWSKDVEVTYCSQKMACEDNKHTFKNELHTFITNKGNGHNPEGLPIDQLRWVVNNSCIKCDEQVFASKVYLTDEEYELFKTKRFDVECHIKTYKGNEELFA